MTAKIELLNAIRETSMELAGYTSYAEIVGAISHNRPEIRKHCDELFDLNRELTAIEDAEEEARQIFVDTRLSILERAGEMAHRELQGFRDATRKN